MTKWCLGVLEDMVENEGIDDEVNALVEKSVLKLDESVVDDGDKVGRLKGENTLVKGWVGVLEENKGIEDVNEKDKNEEKMVVYGLITDGGKKANDEVIKVEIGFEVVRDKVELEGEEQDQEKVLIGRIASG